ncbi:MAG: DUF4332 domain-containing protein [Candidatus Sericytochromatia bacterium]
MQITNPTALKIQQALAPIEKAANQVNTAMYGSPTMATDSYTTTTTTAPAQKVPLYQFFDDRMRPPSPLDYKIANRLSWVGITDSDKFLKAADTPFKRTMMSYLAGGLFLNKQDRDYVNYQIGAWAGQADLMRVPGVDLTMARLMQTSGAGDVATLSRYTGGFGLDKGAFYAAMAANAVQYGYWMPNFSSVSTAIDRSKTVPPQIRWY